MFGAVVNVLTYLYEISVAYAEMGLYLDIDYVTTAYTSIIVGAIIPIVFFVFKGIGLFVLSKRQNLSLAWLSFVPVVSYVQMGRLVGEVKLFGSRTKQLGLFVAIALFIQQLTSAILDIVVYLEPFKMIMSTGTFDESVYKSVDYAIENMSPFMNALDIISTLVSLTYIVLWVFLIIAFFRYYEPKHPTLYAILSIFLDLTGIFVFVVRKHEKVNYFENQRKYYENLYKERYQNGAGQQNNQNGQSDNPFIEYSKKQDDVFTEYSQGQQEPPRNPYSGYQNNNSNSNSDNSDEDLF